jgi:hypothetical protein
VKLESENEAGANQNGTLVRNDLSDWKIVGKR